MSGIRLVSKISKNPIRVGRGSGSGLGKTSGRGHKGQKARAGGSVRRGFEGGQMPLYRRLPKRGFFNQFKQEVQEIKLSQIVSFFEDGSAIDTKSLYKKGLVAKKEASVIKILNDIKELNKKYIVKVQGVSSGAKTLIEKAGGTVELVKAPVRIKELEQGKA